MIAVAAGVGGAAIVAVGIGVLVWRIRAHRVQHVLPRKQLRSLSVRAATPPETNPGFRADRVRPQDTGVGGLY